MKPRTGVKCSGSAERRACHPGTYDDLLQTADTTPLEPDVLEHKYYAAGVGLVLTIDKEGNGREALLSVTTISQGAASACAGEVALGERHRIAGSAGATHARPADPTGSASTPRRG